MTRADSHAVLRGEGLALWRGERCLFEGLEFELGAGQLALVVGPNGSGKTTLLRVLAGLAPPTEGRVSWGGRDVQRLPPEERGALAYRGHLDALKRELTVEENLWVYRALWDGAAGGDGTLGGDGPAVLAEVKLDWAAALKVRYLSAGQRRRLGLATLKLCAAKLWILDEPSTNLDEEGRGLVAKWVDAHVAAGGLAVVATHQPEQLARSGTLMIEL
jgi:heme exporter protein A